MVPNCASSSMTWADHGGAGGRKLVESGAVDDEGLAGAEQGEGIGDELDQPRRVDADDLARGSGGVGERTQQVEDGAHAELLAHGHDGGHGGVVGGRGKEGEAVAAQGFGGQGGG